MGVTTAAWFKCGYKVNCEEIPDFENRMDNEFSDIADEPNGYMVTICDREYWCSDVVTGDNAYVDHGYQDWYIGIDLPESATIGELVDKYMESMPTVWEMYRLIMRKEPTEPPKVYVFTRWS